MRRLAVAALVWALGASLVSGHPARLVDGGGSGARGLIDPALVALLDRVEADTQVPVIAILRDQVQAAAIGGPDGHERGAAIVAALRDRAALTQPPVLARLAGDVDGAGVSRIERLWIVNALSITATPGAIRSLARSPAIARIVPETLLAAPAPSPDGDPTGPVESNIAQINAPALWSLGARGDGVVVATMDTGVDTSDPDLAGSWRGGTNSWYDPYGQHPLTPIDLDGHGTGTMGVIVGGSAGGTAIGVAPESTWIAARIFNDNGVATTTAIHQAFQWLLDPDSNAATADEPAIVNGSWTFGSPGCNLAFEPDLAALVASGIMPVFAAGNFGPATGTSASPANNPGAFPVGAVDGGDAVWSGSSRGPTDCGRPTPVTFPAAAAPGVDIRTSGRFGLYATATGTSLAAPHVSGAAALLLGSLPGATVGEVEAALSATASDIAPVGPDDATGAGRLDVLAAYEWLTAPPPPGPGPTPPGPTPTPTATLPPGDTLGPLTGVIAAAPNPTNGSVPVIVAATIDDATTGGSVVTAAELFVDVASAEGSGQQMSGTFGTTSVTATGALDAPLLASLAEGPHLVWVRGRDGAGNWGPLSSTAVVVDRTAPTTTGLSVAPVRSDGAASVELSAVGDDASGVITAEAFVDLDPGVGSGLPLEAADGGFGSSSETVGGSVGTAGLLAGEHLVSVRVRDGAGNWGQPAVVPILVTPADTVFADGFESGTLGAWTTVGSARLALRSTAAAAGLYGLAVTLAGKSAAYVVDASPAAETTYHVRFSLDPTAASTGSRSIEVLTGLGPSGGAVFRLQYRRTSTGVAQVRLLVTRKGGQAATAWQATGTGPHAVEIAWTSATSGSASLSIDGSVRQTLGGIDTSAGRVESVTLGAVAGLGSGLTGFLAFDRFVATRGSTVGP